MGIFFLFFYFLLRQISWFYHPLHPQPVHFWQKTAIFLRKICGSKRMIGILIIRICLSFADDMHLLHPQPDKPTANQVLWVMWPPKHRDCQRTAWCGSFVITKCFGWCDHQVLITTQPVRLIFGIRLMISVMFIRSTRWWKCPILRGKNKNRTSPKTSHKLATGGLLTVPVCRWSPKALGPPVIPGHVPYIYGHPTPYPCWGKCPQGRIAHAMKFSPSCIFDQSHCLLQIQHNKYAPLRSTHLPLKSP